MLFSWFVLTVFAIHFNTFRTGLPQLQVAMEKWGVNWTRYMGHSVDLPCGDELRMLKLNKRLGSRIGALQEQGIFDIIKG